MIERALRILPALNNVLSRHGAPIDSNDTLALRKIMEVLEPFKRAILVMCRDDASLLHDDRALQLLLSTLRENRSDLAQMLREELELEIRKRRTVMSSVLQILENSQYDFNLESSLGTRHPSDSEILDVLREIIDATELCSSEVETSVSS